MIGIFLSSWLLIFLNHCYYKYCCIEKNICILASWFNWDTTKKLFCIKWFIEDRTWCTYFIVWLICCLLIHITEFLPTRSRLGPTSMEFQLNETFDGQLVKPSWCLLVSTTYLKRKNGHTLNTQQIEHTVHSEPASLLNCLNLRSRFWYLRKFLSYLTTN